MRLSAHVVAFAAAAFLAAAASSAEEHVILRAPAGTDPCRGRLLRIDGTAEAVVPCGQPIPFDAAAEHVALVESDDAITPFVAPLTRAGDRELTLLPLVPAGMLSFRAGPPLGAGEHLRVLRLGEQHFDAEWRPLFQRPVLRSSAPEPIRTPAGRALGLVIDRRGDVVALSPVATLGSGATVHLDWPRPPATGADLVVVLDRPRAPSTEAPDRVELTLVDGDRARVPDAIADGADQLIAIWRAIDAPSVRLILDSPTLRLPPQDLPLRAQRVTTVRTSLHVRPRLEVSVGALPSAAEEIDLGGAKLTVVKADTGAALGEQPLLPGTAHIFESLPAERLKVILQIDEWKIAKNVDLSMGGDGSVAFSLEPIVLTGIVHYGDDPSPATLRFHQFDRWIDVESDEQGRYTVVLWQPRHYFIDVHVHARGERTPFRDAIMLTKSRTLDFRVPKTSFTVRLFSDTDRAPVAGALVTARNIWDDPESGRHQQVFPLRSDEGGRAELPPLRTGSVEIDASADGYHPAGTVRLEVQGSESARTIDVALQPLGDVERLQLRLPGGAPAAGAEVVVVALPAMEAVSRTTAGNDGVVEIAKSLAGSLILVRHAHAASIVRPFLPESPREWQLPPAAPPLVLRVVRSAGGEPVQAHLTVWFGTIPLTGPHLGFVTWSAAASARDGVWIAKNLPPEAVRIAAVPAVRPAATHAAVVEALATIVRYPWPADAVIRTAD